jgi:hypothetical protein
MGVLCEWQSVDWTRVTEAETGTGGALLSTR